MGRGRAAAGRLATVVLATVMLCSLATGAALAATSSTPSPDCTALTAGAQQLSTQIADGQKQLSGLSSVTDATAIATLTQKIADQQTALAQLTADAATACAASTTPTSTTTTPPTTTTTAAATTAAAAGGSGFSVVSMDKDCKDFTSQPEAQAYFVSRGGSTAFNADRLDRNRNGIACEDYPYGVGVAAVYTQVASVPTGGVDTGDGSFAG